jgi:rhodanese-related sulfurtransferase
MRSFCWACTLATVLALGCVPGQQAKTDAPKTISSDELAKLLEQPGKVFFLDVREPFEVQQLGSVKGYVNIPLSQLETRLSEVPKDKLVVTL